MKDLGMHDEDLSGFDVFSQDQEVVVVVGREDEEIWFETASQNNKNPSFNNSFSNSNNNMNVDDNNNNELFDMEGSDPTSLFYAEFPPLPDFPCKSSSSSSSNRVAASKRLMTSTATSSSASTASSGTASWAHDPNPLNQPGTVLDECMDMMENLGCLDLLETGDICWDPSPLFKPENKHVLHPVEEDEEHVFRQFMLENECGNNGSACVDLGQTSGSGGGGGVHQEDELAMVFFEWLKSNKESVSAEDLRNIKIKKSTIDSAAKRLGGGKEGMKQLLKLILQWVQNHHLHTNPSNPNNPNSNPNNANNADVDFGCMNPYPAPFTPDVMQMVPCGPTHGFTPVVGGFMGGDPYGTGYPPTIQAPDYQAWAQPVGPMHYGMSHPITYGSFPDPGFGGYGAGYPGGFYYHPSPGGEGLVRTGSSATKEARKKRMARQRRLFTHHHRSSSSHHGHQSSNDSKINGGVGNVNCGVVAPNPSHANWVYWPHHQPQPMVPTPGQVNYSVPGTGHIVGQLAPSPERVGFSGFPRQVGSGVEKKQGWKTEKNLKFLLQKVLKQSDVGNLGRIVLPKKEAETHLPELEARDGIPIAMEDIATSRVWNMRYRFWPNNKSRMYLLENTGDFVRSNGLQEGDFIVIYSDVKCGKYMIRGVKVRPQQGAKPETTSKTNNKPSKSQKTQGSSIQVGNDLL
ncbi:hypothetical protein RND81_01G121100 [Saponaria officinalis]|uniref:TF-B3 domain-containing protein n=1 Tax=Saponaria officinalis TaxID=3572 RepID=A0AAW1NEL4_SAPOF